MLSIFFLHMAFLKSGETIFRLYKMSKHLLTCLISKMFSSQPLNSCSFNVFTQNFNESATESLRSCEA